MDNTNNINNTNTINSDESLVSSKSKTRQKKASNNSSNLEHNTPTEVLYDFETIKFNIEEIIQELINTNTLDISNIPNIDLYVDQLTTFIEDNLYSNKENQLTKPMINNYCKNKVIPPAEKKKYTKTHLLLLIIMYNTKSVLSLPDIEKIFNSFTVADTDASSIVEYYNYVTETMHSLNLNLSTHVLTSYENIHSSSFNDKPKSELAILATQLAMEANVKKMLSEVIIEKYL